MTRYGWLRRGHVSQPGTHAQCRPPFALPPPGAARPGIAPLPPTAATEFGCNPDLRRRPRERASAQALCLRKLGFEVRENCQRLGIEHHCRDPGRTVNLVKCRRQLLFVTSKPLRSRLRLSSAATGLRIIEVVERRVGDAEILKQPDVEVSLERPAVLPFPEITRGSVPSLVENGTAQPPGLTARPFTQ